MGSVKLPRRLLRQPGVQFDLVDHRDGVSFGKQPLEVVRVEVAYSDRADPAFGVQPLERAPRLDVAVLGRSRPVDEVQVEVVETKQVHARVKGAQGAVEALVGVPHLGGDEDVLARQPGAADPLSYLGLVVVERCGVDVAIADLDRRRDRLGCFLTRDLIDTESDLRDGVAVGQAERGNDAGIHGSHYGSEIASMRVSSTGRILQ